MATEKRISERLKEQTQTRTVSVLTLLGLLFAFFFLPRFVLEYFQEGLTSIGSILGNVGLMGATGAVLGYVISAQDRLATGKSGAAEFFQKQYPRNAIKEKYGCTEGQATYLWFQIFNPWEVIGPMKDPYSRTFDRSYACRFIFVLQWSFFGFFLICSATWIGSIACGYYWMPLEIQRPAIAFARVLLLILAIAIFLFFFFQNRPTGDKGTGCWYRWYEINQEIHKEWLKKEVFSKAQTYDEALALVDSANWRKTHGYSQPQIASSVVTPPVAEMPAEGAAQ